MVNGIDLHLVKYLDSVFKRLGEVGKHGSHLVRRLEPLLLGVTHSGVVGKIVVGGDTDETVMSFGILGIDEMRVIGRHNLYVMLAGKLDEHRVDTLLLNERLAVGTWAVSLMALQLYVIVVTECLFEPTHLSFSLFKLT